MRPIQFVGSAKEDLSGFPPAARSRAGRAGVFRVVYVAKFRKAIYVLHAFQKKSQKTARRDLDLATTRYRNAKELDEE